MHWSPQAEKAAYFPSLVRLRSFSCLAGFLLFLQLAPFTASSVAEPLLNGSFESDYNGWSATGNQRVIAGGASVGNKSVQFNYGQLAANGVLTQAFPTSSGATYVLSFDVG